MRTAAALRPALSAEGVAKRYGDRHALRELSLAVAAGERVAVLGPNGAGKTTLLKLLAGVEPPSAGRVSLPPDAVGWVPQHPAVYGKLTVLENLRLFARLERIPDPQAAVRRLLVLAGLEERADELAGRLSGGGRQRLNVAVGMLRTPVALLLDEPSAALDPVQRERVWAFVGRLAAEGTAVLFTTHEVGEAERHADRMLVLADAEVRFAGTPDELRARAGQADLEAAFVALLREPGR